MAESKFIRVAPWLGGCLAVVGLAVASISLFKPEAFAADPPSATEQLEPFERVQLEDSRLAHGRDAGLKAAAGLAAVAAGLLSLAKFQQGREDAGRAERDQKRADKAQFNQRFIDAVGMLGNDSDDIKLGGLYALEQLAIDSPDQVRPIIEVLCAHVREHSRKPLYQSDDPMDKTPLSYEMNRVCHAMVTVLGRQSVFYGWFNLPRGQIDGTPRGFDLSGILLTGYLRFLNLVCSDFLAANLTAADFSAARLIFANFTDADLTDATFEDVDFTGANLTRANLTRANLSRARLEGAVLTGACLTGADLTGARLTGRRFPAGVEFMGADLTGADLTGADLTGANLTDANLTDANLTDAHLADASSRDETLMPSGWETIVRFLPSGMAPDLAP